MINLERIKALSPCKDRLDNFIKYYGNRELTYGQFMGLKNIAQSDKMWVAFRLMPKESIRLAAADIAETVLALYESKYPNDNRPRKAIEAARSGDKNAANAAYAATAYAYAAATAATYAAAYAAATAATDAAYAAYAAATAATYATYAADAAATYATDAAYAAYAAYAAATDAADAAYAAASRLAQEKLNRKICLKYLKGVA